MRPTVFSQTKSRRLVWEFPLVNDLIYNYRINRPGACSFTLPNKRIGPTKEYLRSVLDPNVHEVGIKENGKVVWLGPLLTAEEEPSESSGEVKFGAEGLMAYFRKAHMTNALPGATTVPTLIPNDPNKAMYAPGRLAQTDQHTIVKAMVDFQQKKPKGTYNIDTSGVVLSGKKRDRTYDPGDTKNIFEAMTQLCDVIDGPDMEIGPDRKLRLWTPQRGIRRKDLVVTSSTAKMTRGLAGDEQASIILGRGTGEGSAKVKYDASDQKAIDKYGATEYVHSVNDVSVVGTLKAHAEEALHDRKETPSDYSLRVPTSKIPLHFFELGDEMRLRYDSGYSALDEYVRMIGYDVIDAGQAQVFHFQNALGGASV